MPDLPPTPPRRRVPSARRFAAGALASAVAVFGVLALRVHAGDDPAVGQAKASTGSGTTAADTTSSSAASSPVDPYDAGTASGDGSASSTGSDQSSSSSVAPTTRAS